MLASTKTLAQQGFGTNTPSKSAAVDIVSSQRGLLIPRLNLVATNDATPIASTPAQSLLVYNNATAGSGTTAVSPGFYYWDTNKWVRFVSSTTEKNTVVIGGKNVEVNSSVSTDGLTTTYDVAIAEGTANGQVLVTKETSPGVFTSEWVNPEDFIKGVNGISVTTDASGNTNVGLGGALNKDTEINTAGNDLSITGLPTLTAITAEKVMVMDAAGILKQVSLNDLLAAKDLTLGDGLNFEAGITGNDGVGAVLKATKIEIGDRSVGSEKLNPGAATAGQIATVVTNGGSTEVQYQDPSTAIGKALTTDNIIGVGADATAASAATANLLNGAVLTPTYLKIKDNSITALQIGTGAVGTDELAADAVTNAKLADNAVQTENILDGTITNADLAAGAVTADKMQSKDTAAGTNAAIGTVPVANGSGGVPYQTVASAVGEDLTTDGKIVVGQTGATSNSLTDAVLVATRLSIAPESITSADILNGTVESADIKDGTITTTDIKAPNSSTDNNLDGDENMVMVTDTNGNVIWISQSALGNKDNYTFEAPLVKSAGTANATGGLDYNVTIATATTTTLGVVKQLAATGEEITIGADGSLAINESNVVLSGDVTGPLNDTNVGAIQGTAVSATAPTANQVMTFTGGAWTPTAPTSLVLVDNGISKATDGDIILGGTLNEAATSIITGGASNTLAIEGLIVPTANTSEIVYAEGTTGVLRKAIRSISQSISDTQAVNTITGYNDFVQEINITATIGSADIDITLPVASTTNKGQVVNVKIANTTEPANYVNIISGTTTLTYGALPYQGWIVKSNGSAWEIVGRN